jgi:hypothetical protein
MVLLLDQVNVRSLHDELASRITEFFNSKKDVSARVDMKANFLLRKIRN